MTLVLEGPAWPKARRILAQNNFRKLRASPRAPETVRPPKLFTSYHLEINDEQRIRAFEDLNVKAGEGLLAEFSSLWVTTDRETGNSSGAEKTFFRGSLPWGGILERRRVPTPSSLHYIYGTFAGASHRRHGEFSLHLTERKGAVKNHLFLNVLGELSAEAPDSRLRRGAELLVLASDIYLEGPPDPLENEFGGVAVQISRVGASLPLYLRRRTRPRDRDDLIN
jgi:hypothetical protein